MERWQPIKEYEGLYEVSDKGRVRSLKRKTTNGKILKPVLDKDGYLLVSLSKNNHKAHKRVHRLVAETFIENPNNYPVVNHKDECKQNNNVENLEWCTIQYNTLYNGANYRRALSRRVPIIAIKDNQKLFFNSIMDAATTLGVAHYNISGCLHKAKGRKTLKGYRFEYQDPITN